ncbi:hypothetical protein FRC07_009552 [Ceratobasidium sp. 392]|nr:hypothetical protein FRC07_009552 [Ceratobasidium sp. 392]
MAILNLRPILTAGISFVTNFRQFVMSLSKLQTPTAKQPLTKILKAHDHPLPAKPDTCLPKARSARLIASTGGCDSLDSPRVMAINNQAGTSMAKHDVVVASDGPECPRRCITIDRVGYMTPSPPRFIRWMWTRGGGRFRPIDICRPGWERLAVQYAEGCDITDNDETGEPWSPCLTSNKPVSPNVASGLKSSAEADIVDELGLNLVSQRYRMRHTFDSDFVPEQLQAFERLVAKRIRGGRLDSMHPLKQAVHNSLARVVNLKTTKKEHTSTRKRIRKHSRSSSNESSFKLEDGQRLRRTRPSVRPLDVDAARAYAVAPLTDSPPESPGPTTPVEGSILGSITPVGIVAAGDEVMVPNEPLQKAHVHQTHGDIAML